MINELLKNPPGLAVKCFATGTIILQNEFNFDMLSNLQLILMYLYRILLK